MILQLCARVHFCYKVYRFISFLVAIHISSFIVLSLVTDIVKHYYFKNQYYAYFSLLLGLGSAGSRFRSNEIMAAQI